MENLLSSSGNQRSRLYELPRPGALAAGNIGPFGEYRDDLLSRSLWEADWVRTFVRTTAEASAKHLDTVIIDRKMRRNAPLSRHAPKCVWKTSPATLDCLREHWFSGNKRNRSFGSPS